MNHKLKALREEKSLSQAEIAKKVGISVRHYRNLEKNVAETTVANGLKIAKILGTTVEKIFG